MTFTPEEIFNRAQHIQSQIITKEPSPFQTGVNRAIFNAVLKAKGDVLADLQEAPIYAIPASTGSGKSTFLCGLLVAQYESETSYTAAIVSSTIREAEALHSNLAKFIPSEDLYIHTSATPESNVFGLRSHRIVVCTHKHFLNDLNNVEDLGVSLHEGSLRSNIIIDERPDIFETEKLAPSDLEFLCEQLRRDISEFEREESIANTVKDRMDKISSSQTSPFGLAELISKDEFSLLNDIKLSGFGTNCARLQLIINFLKMASQGRCFISKGCFRIHAAMELPHGLGFQSYSKAPSFNAGTVLLDATAAINPLMPLSAKFEIVDVPTASYENLRVTHLEMPTKFKNISRTNEQAICEYVGQMKEWVEAYSVAGEEIFIVLPKRVCEYLKGNLRITGRKIHLANWGMGIGCNDWKDCHSVFLFDEYHLPKDVYLMMTAASSDDPCSSELLNQTQGSARTGEVKDTMLAHRYMHLVQMASRGNMRNLSPSGSCGEMKLFTTMDRAVFLEGFANLFPHAEIPTFVSSEEVERKTVPAKLSNYLTHLNDIKVSAPEVAKVLGVPAKALSRAFKKASCSHLHRLGWELEKGNGRSAPAYFIKKTFALPANVAHLFQAAA